MPVMYALLLSPIHRRTFFSASERLALAEFGVLGRRLSVNLEGASCASLAGLPYLTFSADTELCERDIRLLSHLSFAHGLFRMDGAALYPVELPARGFLDEGVSSMLKYTGKTNELFTRLLINLAILSCAFDPLERLTLLDPMCGKGTTLFEAALAGHTCCGIELSPKPIREAAAFFKLYLERSKLKHRYEKRRLGPNQKLYPSEAHAFAFAPDRAGMDDPLTLTLASGDARFANRFFKRDTFHAVCADLPYGIQHESASGGAGSRNPLWLLEACMPPLADVLKPGGALAFSWNTHVLPREKLTQVLEKHGLELLDAPDSRALEHRVAQAILRDAAVAVKR